VGPSRSDPWCQQHYLLKPTDGGWQFGVGSFWGGKEGGGLFYMTSVYLIFYAWIGIMILAFFHELYFLWDRAYLWKLLV